MSSYKLHYFDTRGLGEAIRLIFNYAGQKFEDIRFNQNDWPSLKPKFTYGKVPVLEVDGKQLAQSATIARFLAQKFGLAGKGEWEQAKVNELVDFHKDTYAEIAPYFYVVLGYREGDKEALRKDVFLPAAERLFPMYVKALKESGSGFLVSSGLTFADFIVAEYFNYWVNKLEPQFMKEKYPELCAHLEKVYSVPQIQDYLKSRKD